MKCVYLVLASTLIVSYYFALFNIMFYWTSWFWSVWLHRCMYTLLTLLSCWLLFYFRHAPLLPCLRSIAFAFLCSHCLTWQLIGYHASVVHLSLYSLNCYWIVYIKYLLQLKLTHIILTLNSPLHGMPKWFNCLTLFCMAFLLSLLLLCVFLGCGLPSMLLPTLPYSFFMIPIYVLLVPWWSCIFSHSY